MPLVLGALLACQALSVAILGDLSLATLGDAYWTRLTAPPITAIPDALSEWGRLAGQFLLERIKGHYDGPPRTELFAPEQIVRGSTEQAVGDRITVETHNDGTRTSRFGE